MSLTWRCRLSKRVMWTDSSRRKCRRKATPGVLINKVYYMSKGSSETRKHQMTSAGSGLSNAASLHQYTLENHTRAPPLTGNWVLKGSCVCVRRALNLLGRKVYRHSFSFNIFIRTLNFGSNWMFKNPFFFQFAIWTLKGCKLMFLSKPLVLYFFKLRREESRWERGCS